MHAYAWELPHALGQALLSYVIGVMPERLNFASRVNHLLMGPSWERAGMPS